MVTDPDGVYTFPDLADGTWNIQVEMQGFSTLMQETAVSASAAPALWELKMLPLGEMNAQVQAPGPAVTVAPVTKPGAPVAKPTNTQTPFQRTDLNASSTPVTATGDELANQDVTDLNKRAADGFLINGTANNGAATQFAQPAAFGNNRRGGRPAYSGNLGLILDNAVWDARTYSLTGQDTPKPGYSHVQGVASLGGPLRIPRLLRNGPNFTVNYQWTRNRNASTPSALMPTADQRSGIFSTTILDPTTGLPFAGNLIPNNRISSQAKALLNLYPLPNFTGSSRYNYQIPTVGATHQDNLQSRANKTIGRRNQVSGGFAYQSTRTDSPSVFGFLDNSKSLGINSNLNWRHHFTGRLYSSTTLQFSRLSSQATPFFANLQNVSGKAGILGNNQDPVNWGPPTLTFASGIAALTDGIFSSIRNQTSAFNEEIGWNHGRHNFLFGGDLRKLQFNPVSQQEPRGTFTFTGAATGSDFADFLLGVPDTSSIAFGNADKYFRSTSADAYVTDEWKVRSGLTLTLGLRYEYTSPISELYGRLVNLNVSPGFTSATPVIGASLIHPDKNNIAPRFALAWRPLPASSVVIRGGYGIYYDTSVYQTIAMQMAQQSPLSTNLRVQNTPTNPLTLANGFNAPPSVTPNTFAVDPNFRMGYVQIWQLSLQRDLPAGLVMIVSYLGNKGTRAQQEFLPNTFPTGALNPCPACPAGFTYLTSNGNSTREAGTFELRRRLRSGFTATFQYTFSKSIDDAALGGQNQGGALIAQNWLDLSAERSPSNFDQRHVLSFQTQYTTGVGVAGGSLIDGWKAALFKDWTFLSQITAGSGLPLTPIYLAAVAGTGVTGSIRPDYTGASIYAAPSGLFLNPAAYVAPAAGEWGNAGRNSIVGPFQFSMNASMARTFRIGERLSLDLRVDSTNPLNHPTFTSWNTTITSAQFGLPNPPNPMRNLQTTLRLRF